MAMARKLVTSLLAIMAIFQLKGIDCLRMNDLHVPENAIAGENITLHCEYDLQSETLYSIKWYKDDQEFYRYIPTENQPAHTYHVAGIEVELNSSDDKIVTLKNVRTSSAGIYRCEVSAEAPSFTTVSDERRLNVVVYKMGSLDITGMLLRYDINDTINVNCTASKYKPAATLLWKIDGHQAPQSFLQEYAVEIDNEGLATSTLGLRFQVGDNHFNRMILSCVANTTIVMQVTVAAAEFVQSRPTELPTDVDI